MSSCSFKTPHLDDTETIEFDFTKMTFPNVPKKHVLAKIIVRGLSKGTGTGDSAAAVVEPVTGDTPIRSTRHPFPPVFVAALPYQGLQWL
jgi:hypothetical protein